METNLFLPRLTPRMSAIASYVRPGARVADIGTDHAYIPVWLLKKGIASFVTASDVRPLPLASARRNAEAYGVSGAISFVLSDGMSHLRDGDADTVLIAGMGGETIAAIMAASPLDASKLRFVLQPMTRTEELSLRLYENGFYVESAKLAKEAKDIYLIMSVRRGAAESPRRLDLLVPPALRRDPLLSEYADMLISRIRHVIRGLELASEQDSARISELGDTLAALKELKGELENADNG